MVIEGGKKIVDHFVTLILLDNEIDGRLYVTSGELEFGCREFNNSFGLYLIIKML